MIITIKKTALKNGWLLTAGPLRSTHKVQAIPATEPRNFSRDPAFGDFNLPLIDGVCGGGGHDLVMEDAEDVGCLRDALETDDLESYSDFRRDELGM